MNCSECPYVEYYPCKTCPYDIDDDYYNNLT